MKEVDVKLQGGPEAGKIRLYNSMQGKQLKKFELEIVPEKPKEISLKSWNITCQKKSVQIKNAAQTYP